MVIGYVFNFTTNAFDSYLFKMLNGYGMQQSSFKCRFELRLFE